MTDATPYGPILGRNISAARGRLQLSQGAVAARMSELGFQWQQQTVAAVEKAKRRPTAEEILGLSVALETSIQALMAPVDDGRNVILPSGLEMSVTAVKMLAQGLTNIGVTWYGNNKIVLNVPAASVERFRQIFGDGRPE